MDLKRLLSSFVLGTAVFALAAIPSTGATKKNKDLCIISKDWCIDL